MQRQCSFAVVLAGVFLAGSGHAAELAAGVARAELTPPMEMKAALGGYMIRSLLRRWSLLTGAVASRYSPRISWGFPQPSSRHSSHDSPAVVGPPSRSCCYPATRIPASK